MYFYIYSWLWPFQIFLGLTSTLVQEYTMIYDHAHPSSVNWWIRQTILGFMFNKWKVTHPQPAMTNKPHDPFRSSDFFMSTIESAINPKIRKITNLMIKAMQVSVTVLYMDDCGYLAICKCCRVKYITKWK